MSITYPQSKIALAIPSKADAEKAIESIKRQINTVELTGEEKVNTVLKNKTNSNWKLKNPKQWNKKDLLRYFFDEYYRLYGINPGRFSAFAIHYQSLEGIKIMIEKALKLEDAGPEWIKWYFDYCFSNRVTESILMRRNDCTLHDFRNEKYILDFKNFVNLQSVDTLQKITGYKETANSDIEKSVVSLSLKDIEDAYSIHSQYFLETYGICIVVTYLVKYKNKTVTEAMQYISKALNKIKSYTNVIKATNKYQPYPSWFVKPDTKFLTQLDIIEAVNSITYEDTNKLFEQWSK